ncbi:hypothetical protein [Actinoplanes teichomyceticus]|uniref:PH (Pleckstrin Homology) domain-containing protein n=1 Tax=Actinoplanes teichomyceticus TaxID=1867 RepID=A0A561WMW8_ACTTI|nr:hypothetical protein [Actinoplanes teichomyceticus]TWG25194.1 hypothetical protein FHX34_101160 [Actinoplanes teichomyceticus]GIF10263.1 hypothetical protein Ate01nite_02950 [Actinoplanes teichomyceticus]
MEAASPTFRPTFRQALGHGLYLGALSAVASVTTGVIATLAWPGPISPPGWSWAVLVLGPLLLGVVLGLMSGRRTGVQVGARGIRTSSLLGEGEAPWNRVVDLRAERRGRRKVVSVYLDSGASVQLHAPYDGGFFAADPQFELKVFALSHLWRSHRFGGLPS